MISRHFRPAAHGFTLIELMTVITVLGLLLMVALPNYSLYVQRGRIADGTAALANFRVRMEQFYLDNRRYTNTVGGNACGVADPQVGGGESFTITCVPNGDNRYTVTATGIPAKNMDLFVYTLNETGAKATTSLPAGWTINAGDACWVIRKDGSCS